MLPAPLGQHSRSENPPSFRTSPQRSLDPNPDHSPRIPQVLQNPSTLWLGPRALVAPSPRWASSPPLWSGQGGRGRAEDVPRPQPVYPAGRTTSPNPAQNPMAHQHRTSTQLSSVRPPNPLRTDQSQVRGQGRRSHCRYWRLATERTNWLNQNGSKLWGSSPRV